MNGADDVRLRGYEPHGEAEQRHLQQQYGGSHRESRGGGAHQRVAHLAAGTVELCRHAARAEAQEREHPVGNVEQH